MAATLAANGAVVSGRAAAALHTLAGFPRAMIDVTVPAACKATTTLATVHHIDELQDRFASWAPRRRNGVGDLRTLLRSRGAGHEPPRTELERRLRVVLDHPSLPAFTFEQEVPWWPRGSGRVDAWCGPASLIVEADGRAWHTRESDFESDRRRDNLATAHAHATLRFTWVDLVDYPAECRELVRRTVEVRSRWASEAS